MDKKTVAPRRLYAAVVWFSWAMVIIANQCRKRLVRFV